MRSQHHRDGLLASPQLTGLQQRGRWQINGLQAITQKAAQLAKLVSGQEDVLLSEQKSSRQEVLGGTDRHLSTLGRHQAILHPHELHSLCSCLFSLWQMDVHLIAIEIGIVGRTHLDSCLSYA